MARPRMGLHRMRALAAAAVVLSAGCSQGIDPLAGRAGSTRTGPTVLVEIVERPTASTVATARIARVTARAEPRADAAVLVSLDDPRPTGAPLVFQVLDEQAGWLQVLLPIRPNGSSGWIAKADVTLASNPYRLEIDVTGHRLQLWESGQLILDSVVAIGTGATPTPIGDFYLTELLQPPDPTGPYGTYAYGLSGYSETLMSFNGGDGVIGLHGTNEPGSLGTDVSSGCVRIANEVIDDLATFLPLGTPVIITT